MEDRRAERRPLEIRVDPLRDALPELRHARIPGKLALEQQALVPAGAQPRGPLLLGPLSFRTVVKCTVKQSGGR